METEMVGPERREGKRMNKELLQKALALALFFGTLSWFLAGPVTSVLAAEAPQETQGTVIDSAAIQASVIPLPSGSHRTMVNLRGDEVLVPTVVPMKERYVLRRLMSVNDRFIVFLYSDPKFQRPVDYAETYNLHGELLEIAWYEPTAGVKRVLDINLGKPDAERPARILNTSEGRHADDQRPASAEGNGRLALQNYSGAVR
jgi:hypothetical protein